MIMAGAPAFSRKRDAAQAGTACPSGKGSLPGGLASPPCKGGVLDSPSPQRVPKDKPHDPSGQAYPLPLSTLFRLWFPDVKPRLVSLRSGVIRPFSLPR